MRYKLLGRSGLRVSEVSLGTMNFGNTQWGIDAARSREVFDAYAEAGGNFIDTAHVYADGASESIVSDLIQADRHHFVVATKYTASNGTDMMKAGNSRKTMMQMVNDSLKRLRVETIDLFYIHFWDYTTPVDEVMRGLDDLVRMGKVLYVAASDLPAWEVSRANMLADLRGWSPFIGLQVEYSLVARTPERDLLPMAKALDLGVTAWSPLGGGVLVSGKGPRSGLKRVGARAQKIVDVVQEVARETGRTAGQVSLAALRQQAGGVIPIVGASAASQMKDSLGCLDTVLDASQLQRIDEVSQIDLGFPHSFLQSPSMRGMATGGKFELLDNHRLHGASRD